MVSTLCEQPAHSGAPPPPPRAHIAIASRAAAAGPRAHVSARLIVSARLVLTAAPPFPQVRAPTHVVSTICDDRGEEPTYCGVSMSELITSDYGVGDVLALLWFKRKLPK